MKTNQMLKLGKVAFMLLGLLFLANCSKKDSKSSASNGYYYTDTMGACRSTTTGQIVSTTYCQQTNSGYYMSNGICYNYAGVPQANTVLCTTGSGISGYTQSNGYCYVTGTTTMVDPSFCSGGNSGAISCVGYYRDMQGMWGMCNGMNCSGFTLYNQNGQLVRCL